LRIQRADASKPLPEELDMRRTLHTLIATSALLAACGTQEPPADLPRVLNDNEKADNFRSQSAQEYYVEGTTTVTLDSEFALATEEERLERVRELIPYKQVVIGYFLNAYLIDKSSHDDNGDYGGFKALTKNGSYEQLNIQHVDNLTYSFDFVQEVGGQLDLLQELAESADAEVAEDGRYTFELTMGNVSSEEMQQLDHGNEWYRSSPWSGFNPDEMDPAQLTTQTVYLSEQERSHDAWLDYGRLFEDGVVDMGVFFGWDYHDAYHQKHAEETYRWLVREGFDSPVQTWDEYKSARAPLTKTLDVEGREIEFSVTLWWGEPGTETDPDTDSGGKVLEDAMRASLTRDEIVVFSGHSGPWYGFALANWRQTAEGDLDDSEIPALDMPADKYQIVLAEGCDTYALGEAFWANPNKADASTLDIVTTTSFSDAGSASTVTDFLNAVAGTDGEGNHQPMRYSDLLEDLDSNSYWFQTMYGVHGIDDNPHAHPYGNTEALCGECVSDADCGGTGNKCVNLDGAGVCTFECTADDGCGAGYSCRQTELDSYLSGKYCVPNDSTCN
jgi:hypothetical protein